MLISREKKFLFIHIQRTAGTSLGQVLSQQVPETASFLGTHDHAIWAQPLLTTDWEDYFKFAFVRNPWERLVSWYSLIDMGRNKPSAYWRELGQQPNALWEYVWQNATTFEEFVVRCTETIDDYDGRKSFVYNQLDYVTDEQGNLIVDFLGQYERLSHDFTIVCQQLGLSATSLSHRNPSPHPHYSTLYTPETQQLVGERYARDIAFFGYAFEPVSA